MKNYVFTLFTALLICGTVSSQEKLTTRTGEITFTSKTSMEDIYAKNSQAASIFLVDEKTIAFNALLRSFKFEKALMEEHFNEKYVHSDKYPAAKFKGVIRDDIDLKVPNTYKQVVIDGEMELHGVKKSMQAMADITVNDDGSIAVLSKFKIKLEDYKVEIPDLVKDKIASEVLVNVATNYN